MKEKSNAEIVGKIPKRNLTKHYVLTDERAQKHWCDICKSPLIVNMYVQFGGDKKYFCMVCAASGKLII